MGPKSKKSKVPSKSEVTSVCYLVSRDTEARRRSRLWEDSVEHVPSASHTEGVPTRLSSGRNGTEFFDV